MWSFFDLKISKEGDTMARGRMIVKQIELEEKSIVAVANEFYRYNRAKGLAQQTQQQYCMYVRSFIKWWGDNPMTDVGEIVLEEYMEHLFSKGNKPVSIATNLTHLRVFINFAIRRKYMEHIEVTIPKYDKELKDPYTDDEMKRLIEKPNTKNWVEIRSWAMVNYFYGTGQRLSTVLNIKVSHLDLENGRVRLEHNKDRIKKYMPLSSHLVKVLKEYIEVSRLQPHEYLFPEYEGGQLKHRSAQDAIADYNHSRGVERTSIHLFRHTFAKDYIVGGGDVVKLQYLMNHKSIEQTMKYVKLYGVDVAKDYDFFNPLDRLKRGECEMGKKRKYIQ